MKRKATVDQNEDKTSQDSEKSMREIKTEIKDIRSDMSEVKAEIRDVKSDLTDMKCAMHEIRSEMNKNLDEIKNLLSYKIQQSV